MDFLSVQRWSPYIVGVFIGLLNLGALLVSKKPLGASTSFMKLGGMIYKTFSKNKVNENEYYKKYGLQLDWGMMLVIGIVLGALLSSLLSGDFKLTFVPAMWANEVSPSVIPRFLTALAGGIFLGIGARWAGGCTSGHGIAGTSLLSPISWVAAVAFFVGGIASALLIYGI